MEGGVSVNPSKWMVWGPKDPWHPAERPWAHRFREGTLICRLETSGHGEFRAPGSRCSWLTMRNRLGARVKMRARRQQGDHGDSP